MARGLSRGVYAVVLAAGLSSRFNGNKQVASLGGKAFVERVVESVPREVVEGVFVVVGHNSRLVVRRLEGHGVSIVENPDFRSGIASSIRAGVQALPSGATAVMLLLADQPLTPRQLLERMLRRYTSRGGIVATRLGKVVVGPPAIFPRGLFEELGALDGDQGARQVILRHEDMLSVVRPRRWEDVSDVDTQEELRALRLRAASRTRGGARPGSSPPS